MDGAFILHLIRHAPTKGNGLKQYVGWTDEEIVPFDGKKNTAVQQVWGSDLARCRQTAAILFPNAIYHADPNFRECHFGDWELKTYEELKDVQNYRDWIDNPAELAPPGGESLTAVMKRVDDAVRCLPEGNEFYIVAHGGPIRYLLAKGSGLPFWRQTADHGHCYTLVWQSREAFEEGAPCTSCSVEPLMANANM
ncbi:histidine phosphatase family protein [Planococcus shenhongbingii]|uniref:Histidine phosphatase family protein n=1 Tax=Planococcus shenhongbingii TaxID=3058398 RepID=A0ABT8NAT2_9BACL|nr:histidine phosphatase family protein [Planococcus sp. N017]MDN7244789.1 histidine phosphatase family protein [Planococcus sp. N017]